MTRKKRRHYSKEMKRRAKIRGKVCEKVTGCSPLYGEKKGLLREGILEVLKTGIGLLLVGEDRVRKKKKMLIAATLAMAEHLHHQSPRNRYIIIVDVYTEKEYRISYRQSIRILTPEEFRKTKERWKRKGVPEARKRNFTQKRSTKRKYSFKTRNIKNEEKRFKKECRTGHKRKNEGSRS